MIRQPVLPVITPDSRILGILTLSPPQTFTGQETSIALDGKSVSTRLVSYTRADGVYVEYLAAAVTLQEEREGMHLHLPKFARVEDHVVIDGWVQPAQVKQAPGRTKSALEVLLSQIDYQRSNF